MKISNSIIWKSVLISFFFIQYVSSQNLTGDRKVNWSLAESHFSFSTPTTTINFLTAGGNNSGSVTNDFVMTTILNSIDSSTGAVIYFPAGNYLFNATISLKSNIVLKGESAELTSLTFNLGGTGNLIEIYGAQTTTESNFTSANMKEDVEIDVSDGSLFQIGDYLRIIDNDASKVTSSFALGTTGQIVKIANIISNTITLSSPLRREYELVNSPKITKINPIQNVGIKNISINRIDATATQTANIDIVNAVNCDIHCIKSFNCNFSHISLSYSLNCKVEGSYFKDAFAYGGNGQGYGIAIKSTTSECLVHNNILEHLRHSILLQSGANGNVISYNYSTNPYWTEALLPENSAGDIVLHGNWPYCNLFEGNIVQNIVIDNSHGINGPLNTFNRNRAELYGIFMNDNAGDSMNFISNEITNTNTGLFMGLYYITGSNHFEYGNNVRGTIFQSGSTLLTQSSLYLSSPLNYYSSHYVWPPIGDIVNYNTYLTESKDRFITNYLTECTAAGIATEFNETPKKYITLFPNPANDFVTINEIQKGDLISIIDLTGRKLLQLESNSNNYTFNISSLQEGVYNCIIHTSTNSQKNLRLIKSNY